VDYILLVVGKKRAGAFNLRFLSIQILEIFFGLNSTDYSQKTSKNLFYLIVLINFFNSYTYVAFKKLIFFAFLKTLSVK
jgi:hypothetical protein